MELDINKLIQDCSSEYRAYVGNLNKLNVIVVGKTGVGKSTLVNAVFRKDLAATGIGRPQTDHIRRIESPDFPLRIYDTKGFELGQNAQSEVRMEILSTIQDGYQKNDINDQIHCIWYCVNAASNRIEPEEIAFIKNLKEENSGYPVPSIILILTQCISKKNSEALATAIESENLPVDKVIRVLATDYNIDDEYTAKAFGLEKLITVMNNVVPPKLIETLQHVQKVNLTEKKNLSHKIIVESAALAASTAVVPIPFAQYGSLIPIHGQMIVRITTAFGIEINKGLILCFLTTALGTSGTALIGKSVVSNLLKIIPGAGTIAGGLLSSSAASLLTTALGEAYLALMVSIYNGELKLKDLDTEEGKRKFREFLTQCFNKGKKNLAVKEKSEIPQNT